MTPERTSTASDLLEGARAIATYLNWNEKKVYKATTMGWGLPIRKRGGLGLYAFKSELDAWLRDPKTLMSNQQSR